MLFDFQNKALDVVRAHLGVDIVSGSQGGETPTQCMSYSESSESPKIGEKPKIRRDSPLCACWY